VTGWWPGDGAASPVARVASEFPLVQPHLYDAQIPPVLYLSGALMVIGGLAVVRAHNRWTRDWTVLVTLSGWLFLLLGLLRMFAPEASGRASASTNATTFMVQREYSRSRGLS